MATRTQRRITSYSATFDIGFVRLFVTDCAECGVVFAVTENLEAIKRETKGDFYPNGHCMVFNGDTKADEQRKRAERLERQLANARDDERVARMQRDHEKRRHAATKGQLIKAKKRADAGVCQHCHRTFANVARHVARMHPAADGATQDGAR